MLVSILKTLTQSSRTLKLHGIFNAEIYSEISCKFCPYIWEGKIFSSFTGICMSPLISFTDYSLSAHFFHMELSMNGGADFITYQKFNVLLHPKQSVTSMFPLSCSEIGGSNIVLSGLFVARIFVMWNLKDWFCISHISNTYYYQIYNTNNIS